MSPFNGFQALGAYDCLINAILYWMHARGLSKQAFVRYNWDFYASEATPLFGATIHLSSIRKALETYYGWTLLEIEHTSVTDEAFILAVDAYHLPFIEEYYSVKRQTHFVLAQRNTNSMVYRIWDPFYQICMDLPEEIVNQSAMVSSRPSYRIELTNKAVVQPGIIAPFMLETDYAARYQTAYSRIIEQAYELPRGRRPIKETDAFKKCFSCLRGITKARQQYFTSFEGDDMQSRVSEFGSEINSRWLAVEKHSIRMSMNFDSGYAYFVKALEQAMELDIRFLHSWRQLSSYVRGAD